MGKETSVAELTSRGLLNTDFKLVKKIVQEQIVISIAGLTAVLLQIAHPAVGKGVANHSNFSYRFIERSENTAMYIYTMIWGTQEEKVKMKSFVDKKHKYVNDNKTNRTYDAFDQDLQLWVAATLYGTYLPAYEAVFGQLSEVEAEQAYQEFSILGTALQVPLEKWPKDRAAFKTYWNDIIENVLEVTPQCRNVTYELMHPVKNVPWYYKPVLFFTAPLHWNAAIENLPPKTREQFGLRSTALTRAIDASSMWMIRMTVPLYPEFIRTWPKTYYLYLARKQMENGRVS